MGAYAHFAGDGDRLDFRRDRHYLNLQPFPVLPRLKKQAADIAAAEHRLAVHAAVAGALALIGLAAFFYAWKRRRSRKADHGIETKNQASAETDSSSR